MKARERVHRAGVGNNGARGELEMDIAEGKEAGVWEKPTSAGGKDRWQQMWRNSNGKWRLGCQTLKGV